MPAASSLAPVSRGLAPASRSVRFRLTASYALFFTLLLALVLLVFRQFLARTLDDQVRAALNQDSEALKGYLRIETGKDRWYIDSSDDEEVALEVRLRRIFFLADANGNEIDISETYKSLGADSKDLIQSVIRGKQTIWRERVNAKGEHFLIRSSYDNDQYSWTDHSGQYHDKPFYYVAIGRPLKANRDILMSFTWLCVALVPLISIGGSVLGWVYAGRALSPVMEIAQTAQRIGGSNLSARIPTRNTGDELDYLTETFNRMIERLELSFNQIRQFSTDVSHELRTPITVIRGQLEVALFTANSIEEYREAIVDSLHDVERLSAIVRALLLLSQAETGQVILQRSRLDLCALLKELVDQFQIPAESAHVKLSYASSVEECFAELDRVQIERMISNLLSNAVKFTPAGGEVHVGLCERGSAVEIEVKDTGRGIAPEHVPHIFDRFYRVSSPSSEATPEKGLGLGLSFVEWIAKAHGGTVGVTSILGKGTTFVIRLPRGKAERAREATSDQNAATALKQV